MFRTPSAPRIALAMVLCALLTAAPAVLAGSAAGSVGSASASGGWSIAGWFQGLWSDLVGWSVSDEGASWVADDGVSGSGPSSPTVFHTEKGSGPMVIPNGQNRPDVTAAGPPNGGVPFADPADEPPATEGSGPMVIPNG